MSFTADTGEPPEHDFPAVGSYIEIAFAYEKLEATVVRHSRLVIQLDNGMTIPFHAVHWWRPVKIKKKEKEKITIELTKPQNIDETIRIAREEHIEHIGEFKKECKISLDGYFVVDEVEAILQKMKQVGCKQSHEVAK